MPGHHTGRSFDRQATEAVASVCDAIVGEPRKRASFKEGLQGGSIQKEMEPGKPEGENDLGPASAQKAATQSEGFGRKYLERAISENIRALTIMLKVKLAEGLR